MTYDRLLFDLDGTLSDPRVGIARSMNHALAEHGLPTHAEDELLWCIGPPIDQNFAAPGDWLTLLP